MNLASGKRTSIDRVSSFKVPEENGNWIAYLHNKPVDRKSVKQQISKVVETYEVTEAGLKKPTRKKALKKRPADPLVTPPATSKTKPAPVKKPAAKKSKTTEVENKNNKKKNPGTTLVLHDLRTGTQQTYPNVVQFRFDKNGTQLTNQPIKFNRITLPIYEAGQIGNKTTNLSRSAGIIDTMGFLYSSGFLISGYDQNNKLWANIIINCGVSSFSKTAL